MTAMESRERMMRASTSATERSLAADAGLTLVEMLVVLSILALVAAISGPQVMRYLGKAKFEAAAVQLGQISSALDLYYIDNGRYPVEAEGLAALMQPIGSAPRWNGPYLKKAQGLLDPWGRPYVYRFPGKHGLFDLYSPGADGNPGGVGDGRDISSW